MVKFVESTEYNIYVTSAMYNGKLVAEYRVSDSAIDDGKIEILTNELPLQVAIWITNHGVTNHGIFKIRGGYLFQIEHDRYTGEERRMRVAKVRV